MSRDSRPEMMIENPTPSKVRAGPARSLGTRALAHTPAQTKHPEPVRLANRGEGTLDTVEARRIKRLGAKLLDAERRLVVSPRVAEEMLSMSHKQLYGLLNNSELESFTVGRRRKITVASIKQFIAARLEKYAKPKARRSG
jgi:hypothetical protein